MMTKTCSGCATCKSLDAFPPDLRRKDGKGSKCRVCVAEASERYYDKYPEKEAERRLNNARHGKAWYERNRNREVLRHRWNALKRKYGIDQNGYLSLLASQDGACAICRRKVPGRRDGFFSVDHDHHTGVVRSLLCHPCNVGVGMFGENPERMRAAADYMDLHQAKSGAQH